MFESILLNEQCLWLVVALFYLFDNAKRVAGNQLIFYENWRLRWQTSVPPNTLVFLNKQFVFLNIFLPYTLAMPLEWLTTEPNSVSRIRRTDRLLRLAVPRIFSFRCISLICFCTFFIAGPILTYWYGLTFALLQIAPIYVSALFMLSIALCIDRRFWHFTVMQTITATIEAAICPAYLVNATHRMSWKCIRLTADGGAYGLLRCRPSYVENLKSALVFSLEELEQRYIDYPEELERVVAYRESILR